jgi:hypothetical protein
MYVVDVADMNKYNIITSIDISMQMRGRKVVQSLPANIRERRKVVLARGSIYLHALANATKV